MREWIKLAETLSQEQVSDAYMIISKYVTHGEMSRNDQFDRDFQTLLQIIPRPEDSIKLYRFLRLSPEQVQKIHNGGLSLEMRKFSSWTKSLEAAKRFALTKVGDEEPVIVIGTFPANEIVIDVEDFYLEHDFSSMDFSEYYKYVKPEQEVIVNHSGPITLTTENTILDNIVPEVKHPMIGDRLFAHEDDEEGTEIEDIAHDQPYADRGVFFVSTEYDDDVSVRNVGSGEWEVIEIQQ